MRLTNAIFNCKEGSQVFYCLVKLVSIQHIGTFVFYVFHGKILHTDFFSREIDDEENVHKNIDASIGSTNLILSILSVGLDISPFLCSIKNKLTRAGNMTIDKCAVT